jgi:hypothetical protein
MKSFNLAALGLLACGASVSSGATISYVGEDVASARTTWRTAANTTLDADADGKYGTVGYVMPGVHIGNPSTRVDNIPNILTNDNGPSGFTVRSSLPSYVAAAPGATAQTQWQFGYPALQDPSNTAATINSGLNGIEGSRTGVLFTLTFSAGVPSNLRLGIYTGEGAAISYIATDVASNNSGTIPAGTGDYEFAFLDLVGLQAGDVISVFGNNSNLQSNPNVQFSGFTLDAVAVPEPTSIAAIGLAGAALVARRRRAM